MKTYYFSLQNKILFSFLGLVGLTLTSCGSYQNKSYYDNDGIYGAEKQASNNQESKVENTTNNKYKEYFAANANNYSDDQTEVLTDIESYSSQNDTIASQNTESRAGWGDNSDNVTINVYNNDWGWNNYGYWHNYWGYRPWRTGIYLGWNTWNYGWCDPWGYAGYYGPYWGYYSPYYGGYYGNYYGYYGYNNWNGGYYGRNYAYGGGRRGVTNGGNYAYNSTTRTRDYASGRGNTISPRNNGVSPRTSLSPRSTPRPGNNSEGNNFNTPRPRGGNPRATESNAPRSESPRTFESPRSTPRPSSPRTYESPRSEPRSSSPRTYESPRSYDSPRSSSGSGNSGSSNGGGRGGRR